MTANLVVSLTKIGLKLTQLCSIFLLRIKTNAITWIIFVVNVGDVWIFV